MAIRPVGLLTLNVLDPVEGDDQFWVWDTSAGLFKRATISAIQQAAGLLTRITAAIAADTDDWAPSGIDDADIVNITVTGVSRLGGITGGVDGRVLTLHVTESTDNGVLFLPAGDTGSSAANRFGFGITSPVVVLAAGDDAAIWYDGVASRWRLLSVNARHTIVHSVYHEPILDLTTDIQTSTSGAGASVTRSRGYGAISDVAAATGTTSAGSAGVGSKDAALLGQVLGLNVLHGGLYLPSSLSDGTNRYTTRDGFLDSLTGEPTDGVFFRYVDNVNSGKFLAVARQNGTETTADTGITAEASPTGYSYAIVTRPNEVKATFLLWENGAAPATVAKITANVPAGSARGFGFGASIVKSLGTSSRSRNNAGWTLETCGPYL